MSADEVPPPEVTEFMNQMTSWISGQGFKIPLSWDAKQKIVILGDPKGRTRARFTAEELLTGGPTDQWMESARKTIENWKRLFETPSTFGQLPSSNKNELTRYFKR